MNIIDYIPVGRDKAVTRRRLEHITGNSDRKNRKMIESARERIAIANLGDGSGYFIPDTIEDCIAQMEMNKSRGIAIFRQQRALQRRIQELSGQQELQHDNDRQRRIETVRTIYPKFDKTLESKVSGVNRHLYGITYTEEAAALIEKMNESSL